MITSGKSVGGKDGDEKNETCTKKKKKMKLAPKPSQERKNS